MAINVDPLQAGGVPPEHVIKQLLSYVKGYPMCLHCPGDVHKVPKPNIKKLVEEDLPEFLGADVVRLHHGAREAAFTVLFALYKHHVLNKKDKAPVVVLDGNTHYSMILAAERSMLTPVLTKVSDFPEFKVIEEDFENKIEEVERKYGKEPLAMIVNYPDGKYGNLPNLKKISEIAQQHNVYLIVDGAYSVGRMPFNMKECDADVVIASAHKSMACIGPLGVLGMDEEIAKIILRKSEYKPEKELELLGCTSRGLPTICLLFVMDYLKKRIREWSKKVEIANYFIKKAERELEFVLQGEKPHNHDLLNFKTDVLYEISQKIKDRYFIYKELKKKEIIGIKPGITKVIKLSTYLLDKEQADYVIETFKDILEKYSNK